MRLEYELTIDDFVAFNIFAHHDIPAFRWKRVRSLAVCVAIILLAMVEFVFGTTLEVRYIAFFTIIVLIAALIFALIFNVLLLGHAAKRIIRKKVSNGMYATLMGKQSLVIAADFFVHTSQFMETRGSWQSIEKIRTTTDHAYLFFDETHALIVPKRAFATEEEWQAFVNEVSDRWRSRPALLRVCVS